MVESVVIGLFLLVVFGWVPVLMCSPETPEEHRANEAWKDTIL